MNNQWINLQLNLLAASFSENQVEGIVLDYLDERQLENLQETYKDYLFKRFGKEIQAVPLLPNSQVLRGRNQTFTVSGNSCYAQTRFFDYVPRAG